MIVADVSGVPFISMWNCAESIGRVSRLMSWVRVFAPGLTVTSKLQPSGG